MTFMPFECLPESGAFYPEAKRRSSCCPRRLLCGAKTRSGTDQLSTRVCGGPATLLWLQQSPARAGAAQHFDHGRVTPPHHSHAIPMHRGGFALGYVSEPENRRERRASGMKSLGKLIFGAACALAMILPFGAAEAGYAVLHSFAAGSDGQYPQAGVVRDSAGNLYGTTYRGGGTGCGGYGCGSIYKIAPDGSESVLHAFSGGSDGADPEASLLVDGVGNVFGTTAQGGGAGCGIYGCGTVFKIAADGSETVLHAFTGGSDGLAPRGPLIADKDGYLYGTTEGGGHQSGAIFKLAPDGTETLLYNFKGGSDGRSPFAGLVADAAGNLFGTTRMGGIDCTVPHDGCGTVFRFANGTHTVLHAFTGNSDGEFPSASLVIDAAGNLYGTTIGGGGTDCGGGGCGTVFKIAPDGAESVLHVFTPYEGIFPEAELLIYLDGSLFGTTSAGGLNGYDRHSSGTVFKIAPDNTFSVVRYFRPRIGVGCYSTLIMTKTGRLYGTTVRGGAYNSGVVFTLRP
jgi:uncharacterized repeat protein (TIGR03803 family)